MPRRTELSTMDPTRRERLVRTATREFAAAGYQRASLNRIIREAGLSKSSFYYYVDDKQALFDLVVEEATSALGPSVAVIDPATLADPDVDFWGRIAELIQQLATTGRQEEWLEDFGRLFHLTDVPDGGALARAHARIDAWLEAALDVGRTRGAVRDDLPSSLQKRLVLAVLSAMDDWSLAQRITSERERRELVAAELDALRRLLATDLQP